MQPDYYQKQLKSPLQQSTILKIILAIIGVIALLVAVIIIFYSSRAGKYKLRVQFAPSYAEVKIDDKKYKNNSYIYLAPGEYEVSVNAPEFEPTAYKLIVDETTEYIFGSLNPATALGNELERNKLADEFLEIEGIGGELIDNYGEHLLEQYPIFKYLPYRDTSKNGSITIGYLFDNYTITIAIENFTDPDNINYYLKTSINQLLSFAEQSGKPLAEYNVEIEDFTNPFTKIKSNSESNPQSFLKKAVSDLGIDPSILTYNEEFRQDNIYYTTISWNTQSSYIPIVYRVALIQDGNSWKFAGTPYPIATTTNMPGVSTDILTTLNNIQVTERES